MIMETVNEGENIAGRRVRCFVNSKEGLITDLIVVFDRWKNRLVIGWRRRWCEQRRFIEEGVD